MSALTRKKHLSSSQIILLGFSGVIFIGCFLLMLPFAKAGTGSATFMEALFTSTSAVCVTGLVVQDTATYWSMFGQFVILLLIQIGGMGVVTVAIFIGMISGRKISLMQRSTMQEAISAPKVGGILKLTNFILKTTFLTELLGACIMAPVFCKEFGMIKGLWYAVFHSVSAFCNAGFDLMGIKAPFSSMTSYLGHPIMIILMLIGGSPGSTAGGMKTTTICVLLLSALSVFRKREDAGCFGRRIGMEVIKNASAILLMYVVLVLFGAIFISGVEKLPILTCLFEAASAIGTVGLTLGITTEIGIASKLVLILLMFFGRVGGLTIIFATMSNMKKNTSKMPLERITVG